MKIININIKYSHCQKQLTPDKLRWIADKIAQDIKGKCKDGIINPIHGEINVIGLEDNVIYGCSTIRYDITWVKNNPNDADYFIKSIDVTID